MKIGIYSDLHISTNSSILPMYDTKYDNKYTTRLNMIIETGKWLYDEFEKNNVDIIVNCGDTLDSINVSADELSAMFDFYKHSKGIKEYHIVGNHEMVNKDLYATSILNAFDFIRVIDEPIKLNNISFLPYMASSDVTYELLKSISSDILFSHIDINGSTLRGSYIIDNGVESEYLADNFKLVVNGHLHTPEIISTSKNTVMNIGSVSSMSFVDNSEYIPSICIIDTDDIKNIKRIRNPHSILFRKKQVKSISELLDYLKSLDSKYRYAINIICEDTIRDNVKEILNNDERIIANKVNIIYNHNEDIVKSSVNAEEVNAIDIKTEFYKFLKEKDVNNIEKYIEIIDEVCNEN